MITLKSVSEEFNTQEKLRILFVQTVETRPVTRGGTRGAKLP